MIMNSEIPFIANYSLSTQFFTLWRPKTAAMHDKQDCFTFVSPIETFCFCHRNNLFLAYKHFVSLVKTKRKHYF